MARQLELNRAGNNSLNERRERCVGRQFIIDDVLRYLQNAPVRRSKHNFLFIGPRGFGKTFLLSQLKMNVGRASLVRA